MRVKGKLEPVRVYELRRRGAPLTDELPLLRGYAEALALYRAARFADARLQFQSLVERFEGDGPSAAMAARCDRMLQTALEPGWDGVANMERK